MMMTSQSNEQAKRTVLKCANCGAPVFYDATADAFRCSFCGTTAAFDGDDGVEEQELVLEHHAVPFRDGCFDLSAMEKPKEYRPIYKSVKLETWQIRENESYIGWRKPGSIEPREKIEFLCDSCGGIVAGYGSQNIWVCPYCGNKYGKEELMRTGFYTPNWGFKGYGFDEDGRPKVFTDADRPLPHFAAPFVISRAEAERAVLRLVGEHPKAFAEVDMEEHVKNLRAVYYHYYLCDSTILIGAETENGRALFLRDTLNWEVPGSGNHSEELLQDLGPWDFAALKPFAPAFCEGDIWFDRPWGNDDSPLYSRQYAVIRGDIAAHVKSLYGADEAKAEWIRVWDRAKTRVYLPGFYLGKAEKGPKFCFAVNGQTGTVTCYGRGKSRGKHALFCEGDLSAVKRSAETTIISDFYPVVETAEGSDLYRVTDAETAFRKKGRLEKWRERRRK